jgi:extracellular elastinolytic metalloproteinase
MLLRKLVLAILVVSLSLSLLASGGSSPAVTAAPGGFASILEAPGLDDLDARQGQVQPTAEQQAIVSSLGAHATWNEFGTPQSLTRYGGHLATGIQAASATDAARAFVDAYRPLFRLSSTGTLSLLNDARLTGSDGHAVVFVQKFDGLRSAEGGLLTVGIEGSAEQGWSVAYASSTTTGDAALAANRSISATEAWSRAAANVGRDVSAADIGVVKQDREWSVFTVDGFSHPQRARLAAVPTPTDGVRPAWEVLVVDGAEAFAFESFIDAASGAVLVRKNLVEPSHPLGDVFSGTMAGVIDGGCRTPDHGPWTVSTGERIGAVTVTVEAALTTNDVVIHLLRDGAIVASQDTLFSPEVILWEPDPGDNGEGTYTVRVCDFGDGDTWTAPADYSGSINFSPQGTSAAAPYPPRWKVFPAYPDLGNQTFPWSYPNTDTRETWCWDIATGCDRIVGNTASRAPWDFDVRTNTPTFTTRGNNASSAEAWLSPLSPGPTGFRPVALNREYVYPWANQWHTVDDTDPTTPPGCLPVFGPGVTQDVSAATVNLFAMHNRMHDWSYFLGFTEQHWNAQDSNFGTGGTAEGDPLLGDVQAGAVSGGAPSYTGRDNANMIPLPDGVPPITNMYLWQPVAGAFYAPCVDGDFDMAVIGHEFGHLTENRMIGKGGTRGGHHAGAMGESFGDFNAAEYLNEYGFVPVSGENPFSVGSYVTGNFDRAIRNYGMNRPRQGTFPSPGVTPQINPLNFSDMGYDITGPQVHADGEIWSATNFDIRQALVDKYNAAFPAGNQQLQTDCADGKLPADRCPGNRRWIQLVFDAMLLMPTAPSMIEAREAYLAADVMRFGGANQDDLWNAFAKRGFGENATSTNTASTSDTDPKPDFSVPGSGNAVITFAATDEAGNPVTNARIFVGHYEARVSPIADTNPTTGPADGTQVPGFSNLDNQAEFVPATYEFVVQGNGYGEHRFRQTFAAGASNVTFQLAKNVASASNGATAVGNGTNHGDLIDDTEATNWDKAADGVAVNVVNPAVTVNLAGDAPVAVNRVNVSALLGPGQNRFTALRQFRIEASTDGVNFTTAFSSGQDAFPGFNPRPVGPDMILRTFQFPATVMATHLRIVVLHNQCSGDPDFQGTQEADPTSPSDCANPTPAILAERDTEVHIAELQAFGPPPAPAADLSVTKTDSQDPAVRGQEFDYVITVTNGGPNPAQGVTVTDTLPKGAGFSRAVTTKGTCDAKPAKRVVTCSLGTLAAGEVVTITITVRPTDQGTIVNLVSVSSTSPADPNSANNSDTETTTVISSG